MERHSVRRSNSRGLASFNRTVYEGWGVHCVTFFQTTRTEHDLAHRGNSTYQSDPTDKLTQFAAALQELCDLAKSRGHLRVQRAHAEYKVHVAAIRNRHTHGTSAHNPACPVLTNGYAAHHPIPTLLLTCVDPPHVAAQHTARPGCRAFFPMYRGAFSP